MSNDHTACRVGDGNKCVLTVISPAELRLGQIGEAVKILNDQQERAVVNLVRARNDIRFTENREHSLDNDDMFNNVESISLPLYMLKRHQVSLKQLYRVHFERKADRVEQLRTEYVQVCSVSRCLFQDAKNSTSL